MTAVATIALGVTAGCAHDSEDVALDAFPSPVKNISYVFHQNSRFNPAFDIAWSAMADVYKGSPYEKGGKDSLGSPTIGIGEVALNRDEMPEIIAFPTDEEDGPASFCRSDGLCPNYVLEVRGKAVHKLGVIYATAIDRGDTVQNGYWTLKAFPYAGQDPVKRAIFDTYVYSPKTDGYVKQDTAAKSTGP